MSLVLSLHLMSTLDKSPGPATPLEPDGTCPWHGLLFVAPSLNGLSLMPWGQGFGKSFEDLKEILSLRSTLCDLEQATSF